MRSRKSNKDRQYNDQRKRYDKTDNTMTKGKGTKRQTTQWPMRVITKLPNSEQSYKGKVKTHRYINRQNQSTTGKLWKTVYITILEQNR
jgi:hypothetical protein